MDLETLYSTIPSDWVDNGDIKVSPGYRPLCAVLHKVSGYHGLAVHTAYVTDEGNWAYEGGQYFHLNELDRARAALFAHRHYVR
jgi:hypothetical protein